MKPSECYRFESCNASVCPLEPEIGHYLRGEAICLIARRLASGRGKSTELYCAVAEGLPRVRERHSAIAGKLDRAAVDLARLRALHRSPLGERTPGGVVETGGVAGGRGAPDGLPQLRPSASSKAAAAPDAQEG